MPSSHQYKFLLLLFVTTMVAPGLTACSKQNWYQGAQSAQTAHCIKEPLSEYEDCIQQVDESYEDYSNSREELKKDAAAE